MGIWNSHTSVGNILGTIIPSFWADCDRGGSQEDANEIDPWGWSFFVPGFIMISIGLLIYLFLVSDPVHVAVARPIHHLVSLYTDTIEPPLYGQSGFRGCRNSDLPVSQNIGRCNAMNPMYYKQK